MEQSRRRGATVDTTKQLCCIPPLHFSQPDTSTTLALHGHHRMDYKYNEPWNTNPQIYGLQIQWAISGTDTTFYVIPLAPQSTHTRTPHISHCIVPPLSYIWRILTWKALPSSGRGETTGMYQHAHMQRIPPNQIIWTVPLHSAPNSPTSHTHLIPT